MIWTYYIAKPHYTTKELEDSEDQTQTIDLNISLEEFEQEYSHYSAKIQATILGFQDTFNISIDNDNIPTSYLFGSTFDIMKYWDPTKSVDEIITEKLADYNALHQD